MKALREAKAFVSVIGSTPMCRAEELLAALVEAVEAAPGSCEWTYDESSYAWGTSCGEMWQFTVDGPAENGVNFCHHCGQRVRVLAVGEGES